MDWEALSLSLRLGAWTTVILIPSGILLARVLAWRRFPGRGAVEALVALPLVLPPTVLGYYLLAAFGGGSAFGRGYQALFGSPLAFSFEGLLLASLVFNLPFAIQPMQRAFAGIAPELREAAWCSGLSRWQAFRRVELPLAFPGVLSAAVLTFAHTLGEFGVVLMVGGNLPGQTKTIAIAIYDRVQAFDDAGAALMSATLVLISFAAIVAIHGLTGRRDRVRV
ncbi:MAG: molybdate transporter, inner rane subunit [Proteobacteria bacterium]|jgi:molybdate transport system permease protein|nr:molybdate transporter, inner rane subunit [Pseudomonadota bacterium]MBS1172566.1 molybdate transporter, inner rane subunit [Pseudomonadota bacterium]